jgi:ergothioneine biosynthesis protein EgtB
MGEARSLQSRFSSVRERTGALTHTLSPEDQQVQSMPDASPTKWHLAHTTWFFETFVLSNSPGIQPFRREYNYLFNSYYNALGVRQARPSRGLLTRPPLAEIHAYRRFVDERVARLFDQQGELEQVAPALLLGINHEEQHQELILMDIKHALGTQPLRPPFRQARSAQPPQARADALRWEHFEAGLSDVGHDGHGFAFDNELPRHRQWVGAFELADRLVTCREYLAFMQEGGYARPQLWLSDGWNAVQAHGWRAPLYWSERDGGSWSIYSLNGESELRLAEPVCHVSHYEADAYARWAGARLPSEAEWEVASCGLPLNGSFLESDNLQPAALERQDAGLQQMFGEVWQWTSSAYLPFPGYRPSAGALGEYNGKFMSGQMVLRGGCCWTPSRHLRRTYRNFFYPANRWQCGGIRLARDCA